MMKRMKTLTGEDWENFYAGASLKKRFEKGQREAVEKVIKSDE